MYSFSFFLPLILKGSLKYSLEKTYVLLFPPSVLGVIVSFYSIAVYDVGDTNVDAVDARYGMAR